VRVEPQQLMAFLLDAGLAKKKELDEAWAQAQKTGAKLETVLVAQKMVSEEELIKLKAYILGIPFVNLEKDVIPPEVLTIIPEPIARKSNIVAFRKRGQDLEVAMTDPEDIQTIEFIRKKAGLNILPRLTNPVSICSSGLASSRKTLIAILTPDMPSMKRFMIARMISGPMVRVVS